MSKIGIFCATAGGTSMMIAEALAEAFEVEDEIVNMEEDFDEVDELLEYDVLFLGSSTWGQGDVHHSWVDALLEIDSEGVDFSGKKVAFFGAGDCVKHGEHFCSALGKLYDVFVKAGAEPFGSIEDDYNYEFSYALKDGKFCGLAIDQHNEADKTEDRIEKWITVLKSELE